MAQVFWTEPALDQVRDILEDVSRKSKVKAEKLNLQFFKATDLLETNPKMGRVVPEFRLSHLRELIVNPY